ncbi:hypothetical protein DV096_14330 [Bradymonadaceae bacterium TMQ3]|uniref:RCC1-like domain-containing protein n=2 Tax=Lujinxingia sediminis TaxID=2480984 RepID=A0ABY0CWA4_9DELT|nr:hypothetical protein DV096_14330 [Bradymonadaceae bacterium TMQ3]RVU46894.1 hypothetical protein EA187_07100 [Lujinxingia sediminis]TXC74901.1 hypothetical protein FRC91_15235 [Bradymonadales bacterium TMQ1]
MMPNMPSPRPRAALLALLASIGLLSSCERKGIDSTDAPPRPATSLFLMSAEHACALGSDGKVWCAGANAAGQLGDNTHTTRGELQPVEGLQNAAGVALSPVHNSCAWDTEGALWCWGGNESGLLGATTDADNSPMPVRIADLPPVTAAALGAYHACALSADGRVFCWGENRRGQLGRGSASSPDPTPQPVELNKKAIALTAGLEHTCALTETGDVFCWGHNRHGALGTSTEGDIAPAPLQLKLSEPAHAIAAAGYHTCTVTGPERTLTCWGDNSFGQLGLGDRLPRAEPTPIPGALALAELATSGAAICFRTIDATVFCAGGPPDAPADTATRFNATPLLSRTRAMHGAMGGICGIQDDHQIACRKLENATD